MSQDTLCITLVSGGARECGEAYGTQFENLILGFCQQEVEPDKDRLAYALRCWPHIEKDAPLSAQFMLGLAAGAHLPLEYVTLLSLHEEIGHLPHCTAFVATRPATEGGKTINAQNWDWGTQLYPWPGLLRLEMAGTPPVVTYHFPGLWACAGLNQAGLSLVWTSTGLMPRVLPEVGVPTYVVVAELLQRTSVEDAIRYIQSVKLAGSFNFFLGDASGVIAVIEAMPSYVWVDQSGPALCRGNHYLGEEMIRLSKQDISGSVKDTDATDLRCKRMTELVNSHFGRISADVAKAILTDRPGSGRSIHTYPELDERDGIRVMTLDSMFAISQDRVWYTSRGGREPGPWQEVAL